ncbi:MAG: hypothetical protein Q9169_004515 [Polycauliona sp. 2 TL-2023]
MPFPMLELPSELRNMIYREIVLSQVKDPGLARLYDDYGFDTRKPGEHHNKPKRDDAMSLMLTNKQINAEACALLSEERFFQSSINWGNFVHNIVNMADDEIALGRLSPIELLRTSRNMEIIISSEWLLYHTLGIGLEPLTYGYSAYNHAEALSVLCNSLASQSLRFKNVVVAMPCYCTAPDFMAKYELTPRTDKHRCFPADGLEHLLAPLGRLRAHRIQFVHECESPHTAELHAIFHGVAATVQSLTPMTGVSKEESEWSNLWQEANLNRPSTPVVYKLKEAKDYLDKCSQGQQSVNEQGMWRERCQQCLQAARHWLEEHR